jgi:hypothetical protein
MNMFGESTGQAMERERSRSDVGRDAETIAGPLAGLLGIDLAEMRIDPCPGCGSASSYAAFQVYDGGLA